jgi:hypothetical protein
MSKLDDYFDGRKKHAQVFPDAWFELEDITDCLNELSGLRTNKTLLEKTVNDAREAMLRTTYNDLYRPLYEWLTANPKEGNETIL